MRELKMTTEKDVEQYLKKRLHEMGGICWKFTSPGTAGVPDRIVLYRSMICFVELKRPERGETALIQEFRINQLKKQGAHVYLIDSKWKVDTLCDELQTGMYPDEI